MDLCFMSDSCDLLLCVSVWRVKGNEEGEFECVALTVSRQEDLT